MLFCGVELASRIEAAERDLVAACATAAQRRGDVYLERIGGGLAAWTGAGSPLNKVVGLGFHTFDQAAWLRIERAHAERHAAVSVEISTLGDVAIGQWLTGRGYRLVGVENVSGRTIAPLAPPPLPDGVQIGVAGPEDFEAWLDVTITGFAAPDAQGVPSHEPFDREGAERCVRDFAEAPGFVRWFARRHGQPAGAATMRMADGIAQLCGSATLPAHRRRGLQSALLAHRLDAAARAGCTIAVVTTQPGSKSQQNVRRNGFDLLYSRIVLRREAE